MVNDYAYPERKSVPGSAERNSAAIQGIVGPLLKEWCKQVTSDSELKVLEIGSGEGKQLAALSRANSEEVKARIVFQPTEGDETSCKDVDRECQNLYNVKPCMRIDIDNDDDWQKLIQGGPYHIVLIINVIHIIPIATMHKLYRQLNRPGVLASRPAQLIFYGALTKANEILSRGNCDFNTYLQAKNPSFGIRSIQKDIVERITKSFNRESSVVPETIIDVPNGNRIVIINLESS